MSVQESAVCNVHIAGGTTSIGGRAAPSAGIAARSGRTDPACALASIKRQLAYAYLSDLEEWMAGDEARFSRMVGGRGESIGSPEAWVQNLRSIAANPVAVAVYPELPKQIRGRLRELGFDE